MANQLEEHRKAFARQAIFEPSNAGGASASILSVGMSPFNNSGSSLYVPSTSYTASSLTTR